MARDAYAGKAVLMRVTVTVNDHLPFTGQLAQVASRQLSPRSWTPRDLLLELGYAQSCIGTRFFR